MDGVIKPDEKCFMVALHEAGGKNPRPLINSDDFEMHYKRAWYLLNKWAEKGWYDWGVTLDMGWLTEEGVAVAEKWKEEGWTE